MTIRREELEAEYPDLSDVVDSAAVPFTPVHPGEILREEFLEPKGISAYRLAKDIGVPLTRITAILEGKRAITADTALRLSRYFRMSEGFWANLQAHYDIEVAKRALGDRLDTEVKAMEAA
ncbi:addiction module antidote protein, HigA family [Azospirillum oryzae]|uniref:Addiction module antidote protein, HigA family n=1 Tax=Azospirillum oryzae TaxID=286727 RepID=A0A1X7HQ71_9PROT|nr:HigA family addiction module antitoxin [Azospirillum oryzae]SMF90900.1 addiction module antidote protein, HigA family [Azospirillum oryzae]